MSANLNMFPRQQEILLAQVDVKLSEWVSPNPFCTKTMKIYGYPDKELTRVMFGDTDIINEVDIDEIAGLIEE